MWQDPDWHQRLLFLVDNCSMPFAEVARRLDKNPGTIRKAYARLKRMEAGKTAEPNRKNWPSYRKE